MRRVFKVRKCRRFSPQGPLPFRPLSLGSGLPFIADFKPFEGRFLCVASARSMILNHGANVPPKGHLATSGDIFGCHSSRVGVLLASDG